MRFNDEFSKHKSTSVWRLMSKGWFLRSLIGLTSTLTLSCIGSALLPLSAAFASTGVICSFLTMAAVVAANFYTCMLLLRAARHTGATDYESLGYKIGGHPWKFFTELSQFILMFGTLLGSVAQLGEASATALEQLWCGSGPPEWLIAPCDEEICGGKWLTVFYVLVFVAPWAFVMVMNQHKYAGYISYPMVLVTAICIMVQCIKTGFPELGTGLSWTSFGTIGDFSGSVATWGFAFYIQSIMMPLYGEMPEGSAGESLIRSGTAITMFGTAMLPYLMVGFFGAALWGQAAVETGNILQNDIFGTANEEGVFECPSVAQGVLNLLMTVYLALGCPPFEFILRQMLDSWVEAMRRHIPFVARIVPAHEEGGWKRRGRLLFMSFVTLGAVTVLAVLFPNNSSKVLAATGATGVMLVSYIIPVVNHLMLYYGKAKCQVPGYVDPNHALTTYLKHTEGPAEDSMHDSVDDSAQSLAMGGLEKAKDADAVEVGEEELGVHNYREHIDKGGPVSNAIFHVCIPLLVVSGGIFAGLCTLIYIEDY